MTTDSPTTDTSSPAQTERPRFPYGTAYAGFYVIANLVALPLALLMIPLGNATNVLIVRVAVLIAIAGIYFIAIRWAVTKHIVPYVTVTNTLLRGYGNRFSLKNPYLRGVATFWALNMLVQVCTGPFEDLLESQLSIIPNFLSQLILHGLIGFFPFVIAVKYVVLRPYRLRRLLPFLGLLILLNFSTATAIAAIQARQEWAFRNQVYCELLQPGMTKAEVDAALKPLGLRHQISWGREVFDGPTILQVNTLTEPTFDSPDVEYGLLLVLGYDSNDHLIMVGHRQPLSFNYEPIECPLPFR